ncbi:acyl-coenzyme A oxidase-like protein [Kogia breviceps]|uniref:acyl-coenzyme A oxidase-like protein n=1 Tax=Kogia breviceps TaxID=27615 RepID=UPI0034D2E0AB
MRARLTEHWAPILGFFLRLWVSAGPQALKSRSSWAPEGISMAIFPFTCKWTDTPLLSGSCRATRFSLPCLLSAPPDGTKQRYDLSLDEMRALTFQRVAFAVGLPLIKRTIQDQAEKTKNFVSWRLVIGEVLSISDMATGVKFGIIYWRFGGATRNLGCPARVTQWLQSLQEQKYTGMLAVTEKGHRSNVRGIPTGATFDLSAQEFVIDTPCENAEKMYFGNAVCGNYAAVFAQLIINGRSQGLHCFIVPVHDEDGSMYPGVTAIDMMYKEGLHGVDTGILRFDKVRIPRENLLDKFGSVAPDGQYHSPVQDKSARFNATLAVLTPSRLAVTFQATRSMKVRVLCLKIMPGTVRKRTRVFRFAANIILMGVIKSGHLVANLPCCWARGGRAGLLEVAFSQGPVGGQWEGPQMDPCAVVHGLPGSFPADRGDLCTQGVQAEPDGPPVLVMASGLTGWHADEWKTVTQTSRNE